MRGKDEQQLDVFSYISPEQRVPPNHALRPLRVMTDEALRELQPRFDRLYAKTGRPSIAPEKLLRALLLQALYSVRSERMLMEQLNYNLLFRWFVGLNMDDSVWDVTVFTKNRERLLDGDIAEAFFQAALQPLLTALESLNEQIAEYNERIEKLAQQSYPQVALLKQIKGVGTLIALTFLLTLEDPHRFRKSRDVGCYLGLQPGRRNSGQSQPQMHISKEGDP